KKASKTKISIDQNNTLFKDQDFQVKDNISYFDVSPDEKKIAFISRGELFVSDIKGKFVKKINTNSGERVKEVKWLKDNRTLLNSQTSTGYTNLYTISADGKNDQKRLTSEAKNDVNLVLGHDLDNAAYISGRDELRLIDLRTFKSTTAVNDEFWALYPPTPQFSPDDSYLVYNAYRNFELDIFTYNIATKKIINLTQTGVTEANPKWSADGKYIYFESNLTQPNFPRGKGETHIYKMALDRYEDPFTADKFNELFKKEDKDDTQKEKDKKEDESSKKPVKISINEDGLMDRLEQIGPDFGSQSDVYEVTKDDAVYIYYISNHDKGDPALWRTIIKPFEKNKTEKVADKKVRGFQMNNVKDDHFVLLDGNIYTLNLKNNDIDEIEIDKTFRKNLVNEFNQMFYEAWAGFESNYYDQNFHGQNWQQLRDKYAKFLPYLTRRSQLSLLFNDMLGELNTSHFGFSSDGKEDDTYYGSHTQSTGIVFSKDDPYKIEHIVAKGPADIAGKDLKPGDVLKSVNGKEVDQSVNREFYFTAPSLDKELQVVFSRNNKLDTVNIHPISSRNFRDLLYDEWIANNQSYVDEKSNKRIAYVYMKDMSAESLNHFKREMVSEAYNRDALILDLRYNTGGNVHDDVLQFLSQKPYAQWKYRNGKLAPQPNFGPAAKPIILLVNAQTLSDAEVTAAGFKALNLGKIVGTHTYRWIIFTSGASLVDGSYYRLPSWGCYTLNGDDLEKTGVAPDIYVKKTFKDRLTEKDPQLDTAIEEIMKDLNK
ncbi:MAG: S41 family peptidase, partial [Gillisia sp.]